VTQPLVSPIDKNVFGKDIKLAISQLPDPIPNSTIHKPKSWLTLRNRIRIALALLRRRQRQAKPVL